MTLPLRKELLRGVLAADLIAFHTFDYVRHFMNSCSRVLGTDITVESNCTRIGIGAAGPTTSVHASHEILWVGLRRWRVSRGARCGPVHRHSRLVKAHCSDGRCIPDWHRHGALPGNDQVDPAKGQGDRAAAAFRWQITSPRHR